ncbi:MAG: DNA mismatch repair protein MutS [Capnocytophaga sp.]|nr:DNA mismatch repair protein MutS [Capnocytophaga sp.]
MFEIGDRVEVLDDVISGRVIAISAKEITIRTDEDFELSFPVSEIVKVAEDKDFKTKIGHFTEDAFDKLKTPKKKNIPAKKEKNIPPMEVDLHIHHLAKNPQLMTNHEMLTLQVDTARQKLEFAIRNRIQRVVFIHGVGEGVLRTELEYLFGRYSNITYYDAEYAKYGVGATEVYIYQNK